MAMEEQILIDKSFQRFAAENIFLVESEDGLHRRLGYPVVIGVSHQPQRSLYRLADTV
jgi:hypothetical protein